MSRRILADERDKTFLTRELDELVATLADFGDYIVETDEVNEAGACRNQATLEMFAGDALRKAIQARRAIDCHLELAAA